MAVPAPRVAGPAPVAPHRELFGEIPKHDLAVTRVDREGAQPLQQPGRAGAHLLTFRSERRPRHMLSSSSRERRSASAPAGHSQ